MRGTPAAHLQRGFRKLRAVDPPILAVVLEGFFTRLGFGIVTFAMPLYALSLGMSLSEIGLVAGAKALVQPLVKPLMGVVVDRFGTRRGYLCAVGLRFLASVVLIFVASPGGLLTVRFLQGAASAARDPASISVIAKRARARLGRTFSTAIGAKDVGNVSAGLVGGAVLAATGGSFTSLWVLVAVLAAVPMAIVWGFVRDGREEEDGPAGARELRQSFEAPAPSGILRDPRLRLIASLGLLAGLTAHMTHALFQVYAAEVAGLEAGQIGLIYSASIATLLIVGPLAGAVADRFGNGLLAGVRGIANALSSLIYLVWPAFGGVFGGRLIDDAGKAAFRPTWGTLVGTAARDAGPRRGGRVAANLDAALSLGEAIGPVLAGLIWDLAGVTTFFVARAVLGIGTELALGRKIRALADRGGLEAPDGLRRPEIVPGPGRLVLEEVRVGGLPQAYQVVAEPCRITTVAVPDDVACAALEAVVTGDASPDDGRVILDGQDLAEHSQASVRRLVSLVSLEAPPADARVEDWLAHRHPQAPPEELSRVWALCELRERVGPLGLNARRRVGELDPADGRRLSLAASQLGDPCVLVVGAGSAAVSGELRRTLARVVRAHLGAVLVIDGPAREQPVFDEEASSPALAP